MYSLCSISIAKGSAEKLRASNDGSRNLGGNSTHDHAPRKRTREGHKHRLKLEIVSVFFQGNLCQKKFNVLHSAQYLQENSSTNGVSHTFDTNSYATSVKGQEIGHDRQLATFCSLHFPTYVHPQVICVSVKFTAWCQSVTLAYFY